MRFAKGGKWGEGIDRSYFPMAHTFWPSEKTAWDHPAAICLMGGMPSILVTLAGPLLRVSGKPIQIRVEKYSRSNQYLDCPIHGHLRKYSVCVRAFSKGLSRRYWSHFQGPGNKPPAELPSQQNVQFSGAYPAICGNCQIERNWFCVHGRNLHREPRGAFNDYSLNLTSHEDARLHNYSDHQPYTESQFISLSGVPQGWTIMMHCYNLYPLWTWKPVCWQLQGCLLTYKYCLRSFDFMEGIYEGSLCAVRLTKMIVWGISARTCCASGMIDCDEKSPYLGGCPMKARSQNLSVLCKTYHQQLLL